MSDYSYLYAEMLIADGMEKAALELQLIAEMKKHAFAVSYMRLKERRGDVVNGAIFKALTNLDKFKGKSLFSTWFQSIVEHECIGVLRGKRRRREVNIEDYEQETAVTLRDPALKIDIAAIRESLTPQEQTLLDSLMEGCTDAEVAERLGKNVRRKLGNLKKKLASKLEGVYSG